MKAPPIQLSTTLQLCGIECAIDMRDVARKTHRGKAKNDGPG